MRVLDDVPLAELVPYIDWSPFFQAWELRGKYPKIFDDETVGPWRAQVVCRRAAVAQENCRREVLTARGVYGFWPAAADGRRHSGLCRREPDERSLASTRSGSNGSARGKKRITHWPISWRPEDSGRQDFIGAFAVTAGIGTDELVRRFEAEHDDHGAILVKSLADRMAEAFAEMLHQQARRDWGYGGEETLTNDELIEEKYRGIRPAPGYPACPDHTEKRPLFDLLSAESNAGMTLTENFAMYPAASVSGLYFAHPEARYFAVDRITRDQVVSYAEPQGDDRGRGRALAGAESGVRPRITGRRAVRDLRPCHAASFQRSPCARGNG